MLVINLLVVLGLVAIGAVFAGAEIAIVTARRARFQQFAKEGRRGAKAVLTLRAEPERFFATVQIAIGIVSVTSGAFGGASFADDLAPLVAKIPGLELHAQNIAVTLVVALVSYLTIVLGELVPKSLALKFSEPYALLVGPTILTLSWMIRPLVWFLTATSNAILWPFGDHTGFMEAKMTASDLKEMVADASKSGTVDLHVGEIASLRALEFENLKAKDVMIPRSEIDGIPLDAKPDAIRRILLEQGHSRMPVYKDNIDNIVGYLVVKDVVGLIWEQELVILQDVMRPAYFVNQEALARHILREFQRQRTQLAIVVDAERNVTGLLTAENILEELVGELFSEDVGRPLSIPPKPLSSKPAVR